MELSALSRLMKDAGIAGAGGAGFPSYAKLNPAADTVILNCAECEPLLKLHRQVLKEHAPEILDALDEVAEAVGAGRIIVATKASYTETVKAVKEQLSRHNKTELALLPEAYPSGDEVVTVYETTGRVVKPGKIPITVGVIVYNVETILNTARALYQKAPVTHKYVTICGEVAKPVTVRAPLGMTYGELIALAGGATVENPRLIAGGPMTGRVATVTETVTKTTNAVLVLPPDHYVVRKKLSPVQISLRRAMSVCCDCRTCTDLCPRHLLGHPIEPQRFMRSVTVGSASDTQAYLNSFYCCGCGVCEMYACPHDLNPRTLLSEAKNELKKQGVRMPEEAPVSDVSEWRSYRRVSLARLTARLGLDVYNVPAPLDEGACRARKVTVKLSESIGAPSVPCVKPGDRVSCGDKIADAAEGALSLPLHASVSGNVISVTDKAIVIEADGRAE